MYLRTVLTHEDNTVGSRLTNEECAYIAGFLDGDGSLMLQLKGEMISDADGVLWRRYVFTKTLAMQLPLRWIRRRLGIGYISERKDGITELRINGFSQVSLILTQLSPYIRFKKTQAIVIGRACDLFARKPLAALSKKKKSFCVVVCLKFRKRTMPAEKRKPFKNLDRWWV